MKIQYMGGLIALPQIILVYQSQRNLSSALGWGYNKKMKLSYRIRIGIISVLIVVFFLVLNLTLAGKEIKNFFYLISSPIQKTLWGAGERVSDFFETISEIKNLKKENQELKLKIQELLAENVALKELKKENELLREALGIGLEKEFKLVFAKIIGKDISQDSILIDKGSEDGISKNFPVITQQKTLVGSVSQVYKKFSKIRLISNKESSFDAKIFDTEIYGIVKGKGNFKLYLDLVPREEEIKEKALLVTSALSGLFPPGLLIGKISQIRKSDLEPFQVAEIEPAFNIKNLEELFIIIEW